MKSNTPLLKTLFIAAAAMSFGVLSARADEYDLSDGDVNLSGVTVGTSVTSGTIYEGDVIVVNSSILSSETWGSDGYKGAWIGWSGSPVLGTWTVGSADSKVTIEGSGFFGIALRNGNGSYDTTVDLSYADVSNFTGQISVVNVWANNVTVKLSGDQWAGVEYVFGSVTAEWAGVTDGGNGNWNTTSAENGLFTRGTSDATGPLKEHDTLELQGDTTLAGVTGTSKDYGTSNGNNYADNDAITVATTGATLTLVGEGEYEFYGTVGAADLELSISMGYDSSSGSGATGESVGSQTFGGTNYLQNVSVNEGTLKLGGTTSIKGTVTVAADSTLELSGSVTLGSAISNSGTISIDDGTTFVLDNLEGGHVSGTLIGYYELVEGNGGSISYNEGSISFSFNGSILDDWNLYVDQSTGNVYAYGEAGSFTWAGTEASHTWNTDTTNTPWAIGTDGDTSYFINGSDVTFGTITDGSPYATVNITESVTAGTITVNDDYTFTFTDGIKVEAQYVDVATDKTLKLELASGASSAEFHMDGEGWYQFFSNANSRENHGTVDIGAGVTFYLSDSTESASIGSKNYGAVVTGTGTLSVESTGAIGLYLPDFQGTVIFREDTTIRIGIDNTNYGDVGVYNANATLVFESGSGITIIGNLSNWADTEDKRVTAALVFEEGSHTIATGGHTAEFSGAISGADATITISGAGNLTFSGGGSIGSVTITEGATIVFSGEDKTFDITTITKSGNNNAGKLEVDSGATVNVGTLNADWYIGTTQVDGVLNISGTAEFGVGAGSTETITGSGTVTVGTLQVGHSTNANNGSTVKIDGGLTFITGEVTTGVVTNNSHLQLGNTTFGTSNENGLIFATTVTDVTLVAGYDEKTTFNTNLYDVSAGGFTTTGTTITISSTVTGDGAMEVTGNGRLVLSGTSSLSSVTVYSGATLEIGGTIALSSAIENSGTIIIDDGTTFVLDNLTETYHADGMSYYEIITSSGSVTFSTEEGAYSFVYGDNTLSGWTIAQDGGGNIWIYGIVGEFTWAGTAENHNWSLQTSDKTWLIGGTDTGSFVNGSDVTFGPITDGSPYATVNITESLTAGIVTVQDDYTFVLSNGVTLEATYIDVLSKEGENEGNYKLTLQVANSGDTATVLMDSESFYDFFTGAENQGDIEIGEGVTFQLSTVENDSASVTSASFSITGTGTLSVGATRDSGTHGQIGLYLPDFEGTVVFREGTTYARFGLDNGSYTGVYNASATLVFEAGVGLNIQSDLTVTGEDNAQEDHRILASIEFEEGSHEIATNGHTAEFAGTVSGEKADITVSGAGTLTFSGESVSLGSLTFSGTSGNAAVTIKIGDGTTFTVAGNVIDATSSEMANISLGDGSTMIVGGMLEFSPGVAASYDSTISGAGADKSTVVIGELVVGNKDSGTGGSAIEVSNVTLVVGALSFGGGTNSRFDLYLKDSTLGFSKDVTIEQSTVSGSTSIIVLGEYGTGNSTTTGSGTTTTINTSKYDTESGAFTNEGVTVTISQIIYGKGDLVVEGVGKLVLTAANQYTSSTTIKAGATVVVQNESALGTGSVSVNSGGSLELDTHVSVDTTSSTVTFAAGASIVLGGSLLDSILDSADTGTAVAVITANTITFGDVSVSDYTSDSDGLSEIVNQYVTSGNRYGITWSWDGDTLWAVASIPEPSMFGVLLGISALALTATRRRRRRQYREAA